MIVALLALVVAVAPLPAATVNGQPIARALFDEQLESDGDGGATLLAMVNDVLQQRYPTDPVAAAAAKIVLYDPRFSDKFPQAVAPATPPTDTTVVATVDGVAIERAALDEKLEASPKARGVLQRLIDETLLDQYAQQHGIIVSDVDASAALGGLKAQYPNGSWENVLRTRELTDADVLRTTRANLLLNRILSKRVSVTPARMKAYLNAHHADFDTPARARARHILLADLATANKVEDLLKAGGNFAQLAQQYSTDPGSRGKGGELGWFDRGVMVETFDHYVFTAAIGAISPPVESAFGYHIIQVEDRVPGKKATLASAHDRIAQQLRASEEVALQAPFIASLERKAQIVITPAASPSTTKSE